MCPHIFCNHKTTARHTITCQYLDICFLWSIRRIIRRLDPPILEFSSKPLAHFSNSIKPIRNSYHLELVMLILGKGRHFQVINLEIESILLKQGNSPFLLYLFICHLGVELKIGSYSILILSDLMLQTLLLAFLTIGILQLELIICYFHPFFMAFLLLFICQLVMVEVVDRL